MKLNHDLVRLVMLEIEEKATYGSSLSIDELNIDGYTIDEVKYTLDKLYEANFINATIRRYIGGALYSIDSLTWTGHQFLDNIRDANVWKKTKVVVSKLSSVSLTLVSNVASQVITNLINQQMEL